MESPHDQLDALQHRIQRWVVHDPDHPIWNIPYHTDPLTRLGTLRDHVRAFSGEERQQGPGGSLRERAASTIGRDVSHKPRTGEELAQPRIFRMNPFHLRDEEKTLIGRFGETYMAKIKADFAIINERLDDIRTALRNVHPYVGQDKHKQSYILPQEWKKQIEPVRMAVYRYWYWHLDDPFSSAATTSTEPVSYNDYAYIDTDEFIEPFFPARFFTQPRLTAVPAEQRDLYRNVNRVLLSTDVLKQSGFLSRDTIWSLAFHNIFRSYELLSKLDTYGAFLAFRHTELLIKQQHAGTGEISAKEARAAIRARVFDDYPLFLITDQETREAKSHLDTLRVPILDEASNRDNPYETQWKQLLEVRKEAVDKLHDTLNARNGRRLDIFWRHDPDVKNVKR